MLKAVELKLLLFKQKSKYFLLSVLLVIAMSCQQNSTPENENVEIIYQRADSLFQAKLYDSLLILLSNQSPENLKALDDSLLVKHYYLKGYANHKEKNMEIALRDFLVCDSLAELYDLAGVQIEAKGYIANIYSNQMKLEKALVYGKESLELAKEQHPQKLTKIYEELARVHFYLNQGSQEAKKYLLMAMENAEKYSDSLQIALINFKLSTILWSEFKLDSAEVLLDKSISYYLKNNEHEWLSFAYTTKGNMWGKRGNYHEAIKYYQLAEQLNDSLGLSPSNNFSNYADAYQKLNKPDSALKYYHKSINSVTQKERDGKRKITLKKNYQSLTDLYVKQGDFMEALIQYKTYMQYRESEFKSELEKSITALEAKYKNQEKEQKIKELQKEMEFERKSKQQQTTIIIILVLLIITIVTTAFLYHKQKISKEKQEQSVLEQRLLRSQMNPHFILNTFAAIQYFISANETKQANKYLTKFSKLLRLSLDNSITPYVPVQEEVEAIRHYLDLQIMRFDRKFTYQINLYDNFGDDGLLIPPMLIQPFVENSIEHGLRGVESGGRIEITLKRRDNSLVCEIDDNGNGLRSKSEEKDMPKKKKSLSVEITRRRLHLLGKKFKAKSDLEITDKTKTGKENGLNVKMIIPFKTKIYA